MSEIFERSFYRKKAIKWIKATVTTLMRQHFQLNGTNGSTMYAANQSIAIRFTRKVEHKFDEDLLMFVPEIN